MSLQVLRDYPIGTSVSPWRAERKNLEAAAPQPARGPRGQWRVTWTQLLAPKERMCCMIVLFILIFFFFLFKWGVENKGKNFKVKFTSLQAPSRLHRNFKNVVSGPSLHSHPLGIQDTRGTCSIPSCQSAFLAGPVVWISEAFNSILSCPPMG